MQPIEALKAAKAFKEFACAVFCTLLLTFHPI